LNDVIETTDSCRIGVDIWVSNKLVNDALVRLPVIAKTTQMRDYEIHVWILGCEHLDHLGLTDYIHQDRDVKCSGCFADLPCRHGVIAVNFHSAEAPVLNCVCHHLEDATSIASGVNKREAYESLWIQRNNARNALVCDGIVRMKRREHHGFVNACPSRST
jgi:hypothetical protein